MDLDLKWDRKQDYFFQGEFVIRPVSSYVATATRSSALRAWTFLQRSKELNNDMEINKKKQLRVILFFYILMNKIYFYLTYFLKWYAYLYANKTGTS